MKRNLSQVSLLLLLGIALLLAMGCSQDKSPLAPTEPTQHNDGKYAGGHWRILSGTGEANGALDDLNCNPQSASRFCAAGMINAVVTPLVSVTIPLFANPRNCTISISVPSGCEASADFSPHPYQFNSNVQIKWNLQALGLPYNFDYSTIVPLYVDDSGNTTPLQYNLSGDHRTLTVYTNHFSRYILGEWTE